MIRICDGEVVVCEKDTVTRKELVLFFLNGNENSIVQIVDNQGEHVGLITYPEILNSENLEDIIDRDYSVLDAGMFDSAEKYYNYGQKKTTRYCPVLNENKRIEFFAYFEWGGEIPPFDRITEGHSGDIG